MKCNSFNTDDVFAHVKICLKNCEYSTASDLVLSKINKHGSCAKLMHLLALCKYHEGQIDEAIELLDKTLKLNHKDREVYISLSFLYYDLGENKKAEAILDSLKKEFSDLQNNNLPAEHLAQQNYENAILLQKSGDHSAAISQLRYALNLNNRNPLLIIALAKSLLAKNEFKKAQEALEQLCEKEPTLAEAFLLLGVSYLKSNNKKIARQYFEQAKKIDPNDSKIECYMKISNHWNIDSLL